MRYLLFIAMAFSLGACQSKGVKNTDDAEGTATKAEATATKSSATATKSTTSSGDAATCTGFGSTRTIAVVETEGRCKVQYTKDGVMSEKGDGAIGSGFCDKIASNIKGTLSDAGFTCQ